MHTREILEDILNNKPYGAGKEFIRSAKNKKFYKYRAKLTQRVPIGEVNIEVFATEKEAFQLAKLELQRTHKPGYDIDVTWHKITTVK